MITESDAAMLDKFCQNVDVLIIRVDDRWGAVWRDDDAPLRTGKSKDHRWLTSERWSEKPMTLWEHISHADEVRMSGNPMLPVPPDLRLPNWIPILAAVGQGAVDDWMWMGSVDFNGIRIEQYKHRETRCYVNLDMAGVAYDVTWASGYIFAEHIDLRDAITRASAGAP